jgi:cytosylglucuronate decarboxylase
MTTPRDRYLFIRILEACNADCFMCGYGLSRDDYRFSAAEFADLLPKAYVAGVRYVRFTGGEPLMHRDIVELVSLGTSHGMRMSLITNGMLLPRMIGNLVSAGLAHVIVSIDGASAVTHDLYRRSPGTFEKGLSGLRAAAGLGVVTRVNSVVGPHNYAEMPQLQRVLTEAGVLQWELSALKLERMIVYPDPDDVRGVCDPLYEGSHHGMLVPLGKRFYGDSAEEQERFFTRAITPRASRPLCHVTDDVIYLDGKNGRGYACSCISHRDDGEEHSGATLRTGSVWNVDTVDFRSHMNRFRTNGPLMCTGCSTTAAGYSDDVANLGEVPAWHY